MFRQTVVTECIFFLALVSIATGKPPPPSNPWATFNKPAVPRSLGPPFGTPGMGSITVPYMPKSSPFFPKLVDPKAMISQKTDALADLFYGLKPKDYSARAAGDSTKYASSYEKSVPSSYKALTTYAYAGNAEESPRGEELVGNDNTKRTATGSGNTQFGAAKFSPFPTFDSTLSAIDGRSGENTVDRSDAGTNTPESPKTYPRLALAIEEPDSVESKLGAFYDSLLSPKETAPGMFGPFGPFSPYAAVTEIPIPKSTIVPSDFWLPSSIIPGPTEYTDKVSAFLNKLVKSLSLNETAAVGVGNDGATPGTFFSKTLPQGSSVASRSVQEAKTISATRDSIADLISSEVNELKVDFVGALNDMIAYQKTMCTKPSKKKPFVSPFAALFAPPTMDPTLVLEQRISTLGRIFAGLTDLQKNLTAAVKNSVESSADVPFSSAIDGQRVPAKTNYSLTENLQSKNDLTANSDNGYTPQDTNIPDVSGDLSGTYSQDNAATGVKRDNTKEEYDAVVDRDDKRNSDLYKRLVQMDVHQGYQSMPPGSIESVQAGGGSTPGHQGGGIKLLDFQKEYEKSSKSSEWTQYNKNHNQGRNHHHGHH